MMNWLTDRLFRKADRPRVSAPPLSDSEEVIATVGQVVDADFIPPTEGMLLGSYRLVSQIGDGGFSVVWRAKDIRDSQHIAAIKVFCPNNPTFAENKLDAGLRFWRGVNHMRQLADEPTVVRIFEGPTVTQVGTCRYLWFAMELIEGEDLGAALARQSLTEAQRIAIFEGVIVALRAAHAKDIRHRDVRPPNIMLRRKDGGSPQPVLIDFDLAYHEGGFAKKDSTQLLWGVDRYLAPDLFKASGADKRARFRRKSNDLYALCVVLFDLFCGPDSAVLDEHKDFFQAVSNSKHSKGVSRKSRKLVAVTCAIGLRSAESARFSTIEELWEFWCSARSQSTVAKWMLGASAAVGGAALMVVVDARLAQWGFVPLAILAIFVVGGGPWCVSRVFKRVISSPARHPVRYLIERPFLALCGLGATLMSLVAVGWCTKFQERLTSALIEGGLGCRVVEPSGRTFVVASSPNVISYDARLVCPTNAAPTRTHRTVLSQMFGRALPTPELPSEDSSPVNSAPASATASALAPPVTTARDRRIESWRTKGTGTHMGTEGKPRPLREAASDFGPAEVWLGTFRCALDFDDDGDPSNARNCRGKSDARTAKPIQSSLACRTTADRGKTTCWSQPFENGVGSIAEKGQFRLWLVHERPQSGSKGGR